MTAGPAEAAAGAFAPRFYRCARGLAHVATLELRAAKALPRGRAPHVARQRSHDFLFLAKPLKPATARDCLTVEESFACLGFGRFKLSATQLDRIAAAFPNRRRPVRIVSAAEGRRFDRREFGRFVARELEARGLKTTEQGEPDLFVFAIDDAFYIGRRDGLWSEPAHRDAAGPGRAAAAPPDIAAAMAFLLKPAADDVAVDLCCGSGTLLVEFKAYAPGAFVHGRDIDRDAVNGARRRLRGQPRVDVKVGDGRATDLPEGAATAFLLNPPFGVQYGDSAENPELYRALFAEMLRLGAPAGWRAAVLTGDEAALDAALDAHRAIVEHRRIEVEARGRPAVIAVLAGGVV